MLDPAALQELRSVLTEFENLIHIRLEERRATTSGYGAGPGARLKELMARPLAPEIGNGLPSNCWHQNSTRSSLSSTNI